MKKTFLSVLLLIATTCFSQTKLPKWALIFSSGVSQPVGTFSQNHKTGYGVAMGFDYFLTPNSSLSLSLGFNNYPKKEEKPFIENVWLCPVTLAYSKAFPHSKHFSYTVGASYIMSSGEADTANDVAIAYTKGVGVSFGVSYTLILGKAFPLAIGPDFTFTKLGAKPYHTINMGIAIPIFAGCNCHYSHKNSSTK